MALLRKSGLGVADWESASKTDPESDGGFVGGPRPVRAMVRERGALAVSGTVQGSSAGGFRGGPVAATV